MLDSGQLEASLDRLRVGADPPPPLHHLLYSEDPRLKYRQQEPRITIMKRPGSAPGGQGGQRQPKVEQKSLKQREQEYAEARQRILGVAEPEPAAESAGRSPAVLQVNGKHAAPAVQLQTNKPGRGKGSAAARAPRGPQPGDCRGFQQGQRL